MSTIKQPRRNTAAMSPLLRKGGAHKRSKSGERQRQKQTLQQALQDEWDWQEDAPFQLTEPLAQAQSMN